MIGRGWWVGEGRLLTCKEKEGHSGEVWKRPPRGRSCVGGSGVELGSGCRRPPWSHCFLRVEFCASSQRERERWRKGQKTWKPRGQIEMPVGSSSASHSCLHSDLGPRLRKELPPLSQGEALRACLCAERTRLKIPAPCLI